MRILYGTISILGSLSDGLGRVTLDEEHEETRRRIRKLHSGTSQGHLAAGLKGFGYGLIGGATSIVKQTYDGTANDGVQVIGLTFESYLITKTIT